MFTWVILTNLLTGHVVVSENVQLVYMATATSLVLVSAGLSRQVGLLIQESCFSKTLDTLVTFITITHILIVAISCLQIFLRGIERDRIDAKYCM